MSCIVRDLAIEQVNVRKAILFVAIIRELRPAHRWELIIRIDVFLPQISIFILSFKNSPQMIDWLLDVLNNSTIYILVRNAYR